MLYRTQAAAQNKQLSLSDALRDRDEEVRGLREEVRVLREQKETAGRREKEWDEKWRMRTRDMEVGTGCFGCVRLVGMGSAGLLGRLGLYLGSPTQLLHRLTTRRTTLHVSETPWTNLRSPTTPRSVPTVLGSFPASLDPR
jgi:hypothetical protein